MGRCQHSRGKTANVCMSGAGARSAEASAPLAGYVSSGFAYAEVATDFSGKQLVNLAMSRHRRASILGNIVPPRVPASFPQ